MIGSEGDVAPLQSDVRNDFVEGRKQERDHQKQNQESGSLRHSDPHCRDPGVQQQREQQQESYGQHRHERIEAIPDQTNDRGGIASI